MLVAGGQYDGRTVLKARTAVRKAILRLAPAQRTLVLYHDDCLGHATPDYHQVTHTFPCPWSRVKFAVCLYKQPRLIATLGCAPTRPGSRQQLYC